MQHIYRGVLTLGVVTTLTGCSTAIVTAHAKESPSVAERLQIVSAGHTGCLPEDNQLSITWVRVGGDSLWKSTCKGKTYVCSAVTWVNGTEAISCAPEAQ